jgi:hypothetical protein
MQANAGVIIPGAGASTGYMYGSSLGTALFPEVKSGGPSLAELKFQDSTLGMTIPIVYGAFRVAGNVIWATSLKVSTKYPGKDPNHPNYTCSFAVGVCEGGKGIRKMWFDSKLVYDASSVKIIHGFHASSFKIYMGTEDQLPDPTIEMDKGVGNVPAFRGLAYVVFNTLELVEYGNRLPNISFEVADIDTGPTLTLTYSPIVDYMGGTSNLANITYYQSIAYDSMSNTVWQMLLYQAIKQDDPKLTGTFAIIDAKTMTVLGTTTGEPGFGPNGITDGTLAYQMEPGYLIANPKANQMIYWENDSPPIVRAYNATTGAWLWDKNFYDPAHPLRFPEPDPYSDPMDGCWVNQYDGSIWVSSVYGIQQLSNADGSILRTFPLPSAPATDDVFEMTFYKDKFIYYTTSGNSGDSTTGSVVFHVRGLNLSTGQVVNYLSGNTSTSTGFTVNFRSITCDTLRNHFIVLKAESQTTTTVGESLRLIVYDPVAMMVITDKPISYTTLDNGEQSTANLVNAIPQYDLAHDCVWVTNFVTGMDYLNNGTIANGNTLAALDPVTLDLLIQSEPIDIGIQPVAIGNDTLPCVYVNTANYNGTAKYCFGTQSPPGPATLGETLYDMSARIGLVGQADTNGLFQKIKGFAVTQQMPCRSAMQPLMQAYYVDAVESGETVKFVQRGQPPVTTIHMDNAIPEGQ